MPCKHRFFNQLIPKNGSIEYLFVGTFNPAWDAENNNNAEYFYGRSTNNFWCIMPHAFGDICLIDKGITEWVKYCKEKNIVLTDLIKEITNADIGSNEHKNLITKGFSDSNLDKKNQNQNNKFIFEIDFITDDIIKIIKTNKKTLKGVFFTRETKSGIPRIWERWLIIKDFCNRQDILCAELITPSNRGRGCEQGIKEKIIRWKEKIFPVPKSTA